MDDALLYIVICNVVFTHFIVLYFYSSCGSGMTNYLYEIFIFNFITFFFST